MLDDSANIRRNRLIQLSDALIANKLNHVPLIFVNGIRANLADMEMLTKLKQAGLKRTAFGVETGDEQMIIKIDKTRRSRDHPPGVQECQGGRARNDRLLHHRSARRHARDRCRRPSTSPSSSTR